MSAEADKKKKLMEEVEKAKQYKSSLTLLEDLFT